MYPLVRNLYKRFILAGRTYQGGFDSIRDKVKLEFMKNAHLENDFDVKKAIANGRYWVREANAISKLSKYRAMKRRYDTRPSPW